MFAPWLNSSADNFYRGHHDLVDRYEISISQMTMNLLFYTYICSFLCHRQDFYRIWVTRQVLYKKQELLTIGECLGLPSVLLGFVLLIFFLVFSLLCCVFSVLFDFVLCLACPMLTLFLICPFLIVLRFSLLWNKSILFKLIGLPALKDFNIIWLSHLWLCRYLAKVISEARRKR